MFTCIHKSRCEQFHLQSCTEDRDNPEAFHIPSGKIVKAKIVRIYKQFYGCWKISTNATNKTNTHNTRILCECSPPEEGQEDGGNQLRVHGLHLLKATSDKHCHLLTLVDVWFSVERFCIYYAFGNTH